MKSLTLGSLIVFCSIVSCSYSQETADSKECEMYRTTTPGPSDYPTESPEELHDRAMLGPGDIAYLNTVIGELTEFENVIIYSGECEEKVQTFLKIVRLFIKEIKQMIEVIEDDIEVNGRRRRRRDVVKKCRQSFKKVIARCTADSKYLWNVLHANLTIVNDFYTGVIDKINLSELNENEVYLVEIIKLLGSLWDGDVLNIISNLNLESNPPPQAIKDNIEIRRVALEQVEKIQQHNNSLEIIYRKIADAIFDTLRVSVDFNKIPHAVIAPLVRIFKENFAYLVYDLIEKYIAETSFHPDNNGTLGMFNSTANELYYKFIILDESSLTSRMERL